MTSFGVLRLHCRLGGILRRANNNTVLRGLSGLSDKASVPTPISRMDGDGILLNQAGMHKAEMPSYTLRAVGLLESVFKEKNGTPRQGAVVPASRARLKIALENNAEHTLVGLEGYTHVWLLFMFSLNNQLRANFKVKPPRLGGASMGVFATRSPHRPNPIGLSLAQLESIDMENGIVNFSGVDLVHGTPILDIKPYIPEHDAPPGQAHVPEWVTKPATPAGFEVRYTEAADTQLRGFVQSGRLEFYSTVDDLKAVIQQVLLNDPRSVYRKKKHGEDPDSRYYGFCVDILNVCCIYSLDNMSVEIFRIEDWSDKYKANTEPSEPAAPADD